MPPATRLNGVKVASGALIVAFTLVLRKSDENEVPKKFPVKPIFTALPTHVPPDAPLVQPVGAVKVPSSFRPSLVVLNPGRIACDEETRGNAPRAITSTAAN